MKSRSALPVVLLQCALIAGCANVELVPIDREARNQVAVRSEFCTTPPAPSQFPVRVLLAVDSSGSMQVNDPDPNHFITNAIRDVVTRLADSPNVSYAILRWGSDPVVQEMTDYPPQLGNNPPYFTNDPAVINAALVRMEDPANPKRYLGGTDYEMAMDAIETYILTDQAMNPGYDVLARYYVEFITDGETQARPPSAEVTRSRILLGVGSLAERFNVRVDTIAVVQIATTVAEFLDLLPTMADAGDGAFIQLSSPSLLASAFKQVVRADTVLVEYELAKFGAGDDSRAILVNNRSVRVTKVDGVIDAYLDSDGDGLTDIEEAELGTNPGRADTAKDGLSDLFKVRFADRGFDPLSRVSPPLTADELSDGDHDALIGYVEQRLGTDPEIPDTDGDGIADGVEFWAGTDPLVQDVLADDDEDGIANGAEILQHTDPEHDEGSLRRSLTYHVQPTTEPVEVLNGQRCYNVATEGVLLGEPLASVDDDGRPLPPGFNRIDVWRFEQPVGFGPAATARLGKLGSVVAPGRVPVVSRPIEGWRDPPALELSIRDVSFEVP